MAEDDLGFDEEKGKKKLSKTTWIYIGLAGAGVVLTYLIYDHSKQSSNSASSSSASPTIGTPFNPNAGIAVPTGV